MLYLALLRKITIKASQPYVLSERGSGYQLMVHFHPKACVRNHHIDLFIVSVRIQGSAPQLTGRGLPCSRRVLSTEVMYHHLANLEV